MLVGCASPQPPQPETAGARSAGTVNEAKGDPVAINCERGGWAAVRCTALNVYDWEPQWTTFVDGKPVETNRGWSVLLGVGEKWTLIQMTVSDKRTTITLYLWARKANPDAAPMWGLYDAEHPRKDE